MDANTVVVVGALGALALVLAIGRATSGGRSEDSGEASGAQEPDAGRHDGDAGEEEPDDEEGGGEVVAVTSDGYALLPDRHAVRMVPPDEEGEAWKVGQSAGNRRGEAALAMSWNAGDFTGARVARGSGEEPWRLEALGRDGEYTAFAFETREAAEAAHALFTSRGVIRLLEDEDGRPAPPSAEQFAEARRIYDETEQALAMEPDAGDDDGAR